MYSLICFKGQSSCTTKQKLPHDLSQGGNEKERGEEKIETHNYKKTQRMSLSISIIILNDMHSGPLTKLVKIVLQQTIST